MLLDIRQTHAFTVWLDELADERARKRVVQRIERLRVGLFGDCKPVGGGVSELRVDHGPGYRVYFVRRGRQLVLLLSGGDKSTQQRDIANAKALAQQWSS